MIGPAAMKGPNPGIASAPMPAKTPSVPPMTPPVVAPAVAIAGNQRIDSSFRFLYGRVDAKNCCISRRHKRSNEVMRPELGWPNCIVNCVIPANAVSLKAERP
jgi:hypothetical protein